MRPLHLPACLVVALAGAGVRATAQAPTDLAAREAALHAAAAKSLLAFARTAESQKMPSRALAAQQLVLTWYDPQHRAARSAVDAQREAPRDQANAAQRRTVEQAWAIVATKLATGHRDLAQAFAAADEPARAAHHFERCLSFDPADAVAHGALGHESFAGFHGTADEIAFLRRRAAIEAKAKELVALDCGAVALQPDEVPEELRRAGWAVVGAKARGWKVWTTSASVQVAADAASWASRAQDLLEFLLPGGPERRLARVGARPVNWLVLVRSEAEWQAFFAANPEVLEREKLTAAPGGVSFRFRSSTGTAQLMLGPEPLDADRLIAHVAMWGFATAHNEGLGQGLVHAMTSLLVGTTHTWFGAEPKTSAGRGAALARDRQAWSDRLRAEIRAGQDWPLVQVPRERLSSYRENVRVKAWSFVLWLVARHPDRWQRLFTALDNATNRLPEDVDAVFVRELGRSAADVEAEWRQWANGESPLAKADAAGR